MQRFLLSDSLQFDRFFLPQKDFGLIDPKNKIIYCAQDSFRLDSGLFACSSILHAMPFSYSGVNAAFNALIMGYKYILLAGIDCDYDVLATCKKNTQSVTFNEDSARQSNEYNYWCSGYHQPGDHISPPSSTNSQYLEWVQLSKFVIQSAAFSDVQFFNICSVSPFKLFPLLDISR